MRKKIYDEINISKRATDIIIAVLSLALIVFLIAALVTSG